MILHFIFVIKEENHEKRKLEFDYIKQMGTFYKSWIKEKFDMDFEIQCDELITKPRSIFQKLDTYTLIRDHEQRGTEIYHFYLSHFRPFWTDCTCEGYHSENFGMVWWQIPKDPSDTLFLAEKNCTTVSHVLAHELLRSSGHKKFIEDVHDAWTKHFYDQVNFESYGTNFEKTEGKPMFLTIDMSKIKIKSKFLDNSK